VTVDQRRLPNERHRLIPIRALQYQGLAATGLGPLSAPTDSQHRIGTTWRRPRSTSRWRRNAVRRDQQDVQGAARLIAIRHRSEGIDTIA
jgi:hypothetical protein